MAARKDQDNTPPQPSEVQTEGTEGKVGFTEAFTDDSLIGEEKRGGWPGDMHKVITRAEEPAGEKRQQPPPGSGSA
jgi:hypothetical protein